MRGGVGCHGFLRLSRGEGLRGGSAVSSGTSMRLRVVGAVAAASQSVDSK
nr:hypothetical protein JVH1_3217 [Rhodococcus sp. JVH1]